MDVFPVPIPPRLAPKAQMSKIQDLTPRLPRLHRLPADLKRQTAAVVLIAPGAMASFEFHLLYLLGVGDDSGDYPVLPEILKLSAVTVLCVYGRDEEASACRELPKGRGDLRPVELPGGHHFDSNYQTLAETILRELRPVGH